MSRLQRAAPSATDLHSSRAWGMSGLALAALISIVAAFGAVRVAAIFNDLWMDEIWSLKSIRALTSPGQIFTTFREDNNHPLNSLWLYLCSPAGGDWMYRVLSCATGIAAIVLAALIAGLQLERIAPTVSVLQIRAAQGLTATLFGSSYLLVLYSSEARGYAPALAFCLLAFLALLRSADHSFTRWTLVYWVAGALAMLAHATSVHLVAAGCIWSVVTLIQAHSPPTNRIARFLAWHAFPVAFSLAYYALFLRGITIGGGPDNSLRDVLADLVIGIFGAPSPAMAAPIVLLLAVAAVLALAWMWRRRAKADAAFFATMIFSTPITVIISSALLFPRYFLLGAAWLLLLLGISLGRAWGGSRASRLTALAFVALFVIGNSVNTLALLRHGRGEYKAALKYMAEQTPTNEITLCSDHDNRNFMLIEYFAPQAAPGRTFRYITAHEATAQPQWLLVHRLDRAPAPNTPLYDDRGNVFEFVRRFPHAPFSGWDWYVFRNVRSAR